MSASHSLPQSHSQRVAASLPFSPSQSNNHRQPSSIGTPTKPPLPRGSISSIPPHVRSGSIVSSKSRYNGSIHGSPIMESPHVSIPMYQPRPLSSGSAISSSFFYPTRSNAGTPPPVPPLPTIPQTPPRPLSAGSMTSSEAHAMTPVHLTSFRHSMKESDVSDSLHASTEDLHYHNTLSSGSKVTTQKHSREPLLPIGTKSPPRQPHLTSRPTLSISSGPYGRSESNISPGGRMRDSFEKLFKRNSQKKISPVSPSNSRNHTGNESRSPYINRSIQDSPISPATNGRMTFEVSDDEAPLSAVSRYKESASPAAASSVSFAPMNFNPIPVDATPPLSHVPIQDPKTQRPARKYRFHLSRNRFFLDGLVMTGGDSPWAFIATLTLLLVISGIWFGTTCVWWWTNESPAVAAIGAYLCLLTISSMLATVRFFRRLLEVSRV